MVGIFPKLSGRKSGHRLSQSTVHISETPQPNLEPASSLSASTAHGIETEDAFKLIEQPTEPLNQDQPVRCPLPEPSILNDGRIWSIWKARLSSVNSGVITELPVVKEGQPHLGSESGEPKPVSAPQRRMLPSLGAPERTFLTLF